MFIVVTDIVDESVKFADIIPKTIENLNNNKIFFTEIEASSETKSGKVLVRHLTSEEFKKEFKASKELADHYAGESDKISKIIRKSN